MRLIDADALVNALLNLTYVGDGDFYNGREAERDNIVDMINNATAIEAQLVKNGSWEEIRNAYGRLEGWQHTTCGCISPHKSAYCHLCGARMS